MKAHELNEREKVILRERRSGMTFKAIAKKYNVKPDKIRTIFAKAIKKENFLKLAAQYRPNTIVCNNFLFDRTEVPL